MSALVIKKRVKNAILYENGFIRVDNIRFSYPHLDKAWKKKGDTGEAKFSLTGMMSKETHEEAKNLIRDEMTRILKEAKVTLKAAMKFMRDGDAGVEDGDDDAENTYAKHWYVSAREANRPTLRIVRNGKAEKLDPVDDLEEIVEKFYGGAYGHMLIRPWVQDNDFGKRLNAGLMGVVFSKKGEAFGQGRIDDDDAWDDVEDSEEGGSSAKASAIDDDDDPM